jgi:hypothetical protein
MKNGIIMTLYLTLGLSLWQKQAHAHLKHIWPSFVAWNVAIDIGIVYKLR